MPDRKVISNTSPLLYLFQVGQLSLLQGLYGEVHVPLAVQAELRAGASLGCLTPDVSQLPWLQVQPLLDRSLLPAVADLGSGEAEAIALALSNPGSLLILDDSLGRETARLRGLTYTGTLGVLVKSKKEGLLPRVSPVIEALCQTTMYLSPELISKVLKEAGEASLEAPGEDNRIAES